VTTGRGLGRRCRIRPRAASDDQPEPGAPRGRDCCSPLTECKPSRR